MEKTKADILDEQGNEVKPKRLWTIYLLLIGGGMDAITFLIANYWEEIGLTRKEAIWLAISFMVAFGINIAGLILGIVERKKNLTRALIGIFGNLVFIAFFVFLVLYSIAAAP